MDPSEAPKPPPTSDNRRVSNTIGYSRSIYSETILPSPLVPDNPVPDSHSELIAKVDHPERDHFAVKITAPRYIRIAWSSYRMRKWKGGRECWEARLAYFPQVVVARAIRIPRWKPRWNPKSDPALLWTVTYFDIGNQPHHLPGTKHWQTRKEALGHPSPILALNIGVRCALSRGGWKNLLALCFHLYPVVSPPLAFSTDPPALSIGSTVLLSVKHAAIILGCPAETYEVWLTNLGVRSLTMPNGEAYHSLWQLEIALLCHSLNCDLPTAVRYLKDLRTHRRRLDFSMIRNTLDGLKVACGGTFQTSVTVETP